MSIETITEYIDPQLFIHKNTLQYKLNHIFRKSGLNPRAFKDAVMLYLGLNLAK